MTKKKNFRQKCPACEVTLLWKQRPNMKFKRKQRYYYTCWQRCPSCGRIFHYEEFRRQTGNPVESAVKPFSPPELYYDPVVGWMADGIKVKLRVNKKGLVFVDYEEHQLD